MQEFNPTRDDCGRGGILEALHRPGSSLDGPVILLNQVVQVFVLAYLDDGGVFRIQGGQR